LNLNKEAEVKNSLLLPVGVGEPNLPLICSKMVKCTDENCDEEATEMRYRGTEEIPYCKKHAAWWDEIMKNCY